MGGRIVPQHLIHTAALDAVGRTLAEVLAECVFWMQHGHRIDDQRVAIWKTGVELSAKLGMAPRTANSHLKKLQDRGFWKLRYMPRPGHPSPVTWIVFERASFELLDAAAKAGAALRRKRVNRRSNAHRASASEDDETDVQTSQFHTPLQTDVSNTTTEEQAGSFLLSKEAAKAAMNEPAISKKLQAKVGKYEKGAEVLLSTPKYLNAPKDDREFVTDFCALAEQRSLPGWDIISKFTWQYAGEIRRKLVSAGLASRAERHSFIADLLDCWSSIRGCMETRYSFHDANQIQPSPLALALQFGRLFPLVRPPASPVKKGGKSNLDGDFGGSLDEGL